MKEKQAIRKKWLAFFLVGCLSLHFLLLLTYSFRHSGESLLSRLAKQYSEPLFIQNFKIFAPDAPTVHYALLIRKQDGNSWSNWSNLTDELEGAYHSNRFSSAYYLSVLQQHALRELASGVSQLNLEAKTSYLKSQECTSVHFYRFSIYSRYLIRKAINDTVNTQQIQFALRIDELESKDARFIFLPIQSIQP